MLFTTEENIIKIRHCIYLGNSVKIVGKSLSCLVGFCNVAFNGEIKNMFKMAPQSQLSASMFTVTTAIGVVIFEWQPNSNNFVVSFFLSRNAEKSKQRARLGETTVFFRGKGLSCTKGGAEKVRNFLGQDMAAIRREWPGSFCEISFPLRLYSSCTHGV